jgi:hypothetical protein
MKIVIPAFQALSFMYFPAYPVFPAIQALLFMFRDMTTMPGCHSSLYPVNPMVLTVQVMRLTTTHFAVSHLVMNTPVLVGQAVIYFCPPRMASSKTAIICHGNICDAKKSGQQSGK